MNQLSANIELLFTEAGPNLATRAGRAADAGFTAIEIWGTADRDLGELAAVVADRGLAVTSLVAEPNVNLVFPGADLNPLEAGLDRALEAAAQLACPAIIVRPGMGFPGFNRARNLARLAEVYTSLLPRLSGTDCTILLEPVNTRTDHPGLLVDRTADAVQVIRAVGSPGLRLLFDFYHSATEGEQAAEVLREAADVLGYIQFADHPGRGEPGSGRIDWAEACAVLQSISYRGPIGLEYVPTRLTGGSLELMWRTLPSLDRT